MAATGIAQRLRAPWTRHEPPAAPSRRPPLALDEAVAGEEVTTAQGCFFRTRDVRPARGKYGGEVLRAFTTVRPASLAFLTADATLASFEPHRAVFLDTETTGLAGGTGTYAFLVGLGFFRGERFVIEQYLMRSFGEERGDDGARCRAPCRVSRRRHLQRPGLRPAVAPDALHNEPPAARGGPAGDVDPSRPAPGGPSPVARSTAQLQAVLAGGSRPGRAAPRGRTELAHSEHLPRLSCVPGTPAVCARCSSTIATTSSRWLPSAATSRGCWPNRWSDAPGSRAKGPRSRRSRGSMSAAGRKHAAHGSMRQPSGSSSPATCG